MDNLELKKHANDVRKGIVTATHAAKCGHPGGSLSSADLYTFLYCHLGGRECCGDCHHDKYLQAAKGYFG